MNNTGITLVDVRSEAMDAIQKLKNNEIDVKTAKQIKELLDTIVDTAKTQVEYLKAIPNSVKEKFDVDGIKAIAGTLRDRDAEIDETMNEIEQNQNSYK